MLSTVTSRTVAVAAALWVIAGVFGVACGNGPAADDRAKASSATTKGDADDGDADATGKSDDVKDGAPSGAASSDEGESQDEGIVVVSPRPGYQQGEGDGEGGDDEAAGGAVVNPIDPTDPSLCHKGDPFVCDVEARIVALTNDLRGSGRTPLTLHPGIAFVARDWSAQQAARGNISHIGFPNARQTAYRAEFGETNPVSIQAENVAYSYARDQGDATAIAAMFVDMWAGSAGHRRNMLGGYQYLGVGITISGSSVYATQIFGGSN